MVLIKRIITIVVFVIAIMPLYSCKEEGLKDINNIQVVVIEKLWKIPRTEIYLSLTKSFYKTGENVYEFNISEEEIKRLTEELKKNNFMKLRKKYGRRDIIQIPDNYYEIDILRKGKLLKKVILYNTMIKEIKEIRKIVDDLYKDKIIERKQ